MIVGPKAWLIKNAPDFYFMPSLHYDRIFPKWGVVEGKHHSPAYLVTRGYDAIPLYQCEESEAEYWLVNSDYGVFDKESTDCARAVGKMVVPLKGK